MLTLPSLVGAALAYPSAPGLAEDAPSAVTQSVEAQSVPGSSVNLINPESPSVQSPPASNQAAGPVRPVVLSTRAVDLQASDAPHSAA